MDQKSIAEEELEYECLRTLCDTAMTYRRLAEASGMGMPSIDDVIDHMEFLIREMSLEFGDASIIF